MSDKTRTAACYVRVSTDDQTEFSPDAQLKDIKKYAKNHDIFILPEHIYREEGISGRLASKRTKFQELIAAAKSKPKPFDVVLVHAYDRFARNVKESRIYKELLRQDLGIELISITEEFGTGKNAFLLEGIKDVLNEYYSLNLRDEVLKGMKEKASRGEVLSIAAFGYKVENGNYVVVEDEAQYIRMIFSEFLNGETYFSLARKMNALGVHTHRGCKFENRTIQYILTNPVYKGYIRFTIGGRERLQFETPEGSIVAKGNFEPIISEKMWNDAQIEFEKRKERHRLKSRPRSEYRDWMSGLIKCPVCGKTMHISKDYMVCGGYIKGKCLNRNSAPTEYLRSSLLCQLENDSSDSAKINILRTSSAKTKSELSIDRLIKAQKALLIKQQRAKQAYLSGIDTIEEYKKNKEEISIELKGLEKEISKLERAAENERSIDEELLFKKQIAKTVSILKNPDQPMDKKIAAIHQIVDHCIYDKNRDHLSVFYYL